MLGTTLVLIGLAGIAAKTLQAFFTETNPPQEFFATVVRSRLDTKKADGVETYTYMITFFVPSQNRYISFSVPQKQFDITLEKDSGTLICRLNETKNEFIEWRALRA
jgi:hypothetical protein